MESNKRKLRPTAFLKNNRDLFSEFNFKFEGLSKNVENNFSHYVKALGGTVCQNKQYVLCDDDYFSQPDNKSRTDLYSIRFVTDAIINQKVSDIEKYRYVNKSIRNKENCIYNGKTDEHVHIKDKKVDQDSDDYSDVSDVILPNPVFKRQNSPKRHDSSKSASESHSNILNKISHKRERSISPPDRALDIQSNTNDREAVGVLLSSDEEGNTPKRLKKKVKHESVEIILTSSPETNDSLVTNHNRCKENTDKELEVNDEPESLKSSVEIIESSDTKSSTPLNKEERMNSSSRKKCSTSSLKREEVSTITSKKKLSRVFSRETLISSSSEEELGTTLNREKARISSSREKIFQAFNREKSNTSLSREGLGTAARREKLSPSLLHREKLGTELRRKKSSTTSSEEKLEILNREKPSRLLSVEELGTAVKKEKLSPSLLHREKLGTELRREKSSTTSSGEKMGKLLNGEKAITSATREEEENTALHRKKSSTSLSREELGAAVKKEKLSPVLNREKGGLESRREKSSTPSNREDLGTAVKKEKLSPVLNREKGDLESRREKSSTSSTRETLGKSLIREKPSTSLSREDLGSAVKKEQLSPVLNREKEGLELRREKSSTSLSRNEPGAAVKKEKLSPVLNREKGDLELRREKSSTSSTRETLSKSLIREKPSTSATREEVDAVLHREKPSTSKNENIPGFKRLSILYSSEEETSDEENMKASKKETSGYKIKSNSVNSNNSNTVKSKHLKITVTSWIKPKKDPKNAIEMDVKSEQSSPNIFSDSDEDNKLNDEWWVDRYIPINESCTVTGCTFEPNVHKRHLKVSKHLSMDEKKILLKYLIKNNKIKDAKGQRVYELMRHEGYLEHRSVETLRNCFRRSILHNLQIFNLPQYIADELSEMAQVFQKGKGRRLKD